MYTFLRRMVGIRIRKPLRETATQAVMQIIYSRITKNADSAPYSAVSLQFFNRLSRTEPMSSRF